MARHKFGVEPKQSPPKLKEPYQVYTFTEHGIVIHAKSMKEANEKLQAILKGGEK